MARLTIFLYRAAGTFVVAKCETRNAQRATRMHLQCEKRDVSWSRIKSLAPCRAAAPPSRAGTATLLIHFFPPPWKPKNRVFRFSPAPPTPFSRSRNIVRSRVHYCRPRYEETKWIERRLDETLGKIYP